MHAQPTDTTPQALMTGGCDKIRIYLKSAHLSISSLVFPIFPGVFGFYFCRSPGVPALPGVPASPGVQCPTGMILQHAPSSAKERTRERKRMP